MRFAPVPFFLFLSATLVEHAVAQGVRPASLDSLRVLGLDSVGGVAIAYFRPEHRSRALEVHSLLTSFVTYYREHGGVESRMRVGVVNSTDWARLTNTPYGLPTNSGPLSTANLLLAASAPPERVGAREMPRGSVYDFLTIGHEGGHLLTWELMPAEMRAALTSPDEPSAAMMERLRNLSRVPAWYYELAASYFATAFLEANHPEGAAAWLYHLKELTAIDRPRFTHFGDWFGRVMTATAPDSTPYVFSVEGGLNQGWYQGVVGQVAAHIYRQTGLNFITHIRALLALSPAPSTQELVERLDSIAPGVIDLLGNLGAHWKMQGQTLSGGST